MNIVPQSNRFTPLPQYDPVIIAPHDLQPARFRVPPVVTQQQHSVQSQSTLAIIKEEEDEPEEKQARAKPSRRTNAVTVAPKKKSRTFGTKAPTNLRDYLLQVRLYNFFPINSECKVMPVSYRTIATGTTKKKPDLISTAAAVRELEKKTKAASKPRPRKAQKTLKGTRGVLAIDEETAAPTDSSPWSTLVHLYHPIDTTMEMYQELIEADKHAMGIDQIFGKKYNPILPAIVLNNIAPEKDVLSSYIFTVSLMFWLYIRKRFLAYRPDLFQAEYDESRAPEIFILHPGSDFHCTLKNTNKPWHETAVQMDQLARAYSFIDFLFIVMSVVRHKYGESMNNLAEFKHSRWCDNKLQKNNLLTFTSRKFSEVKLSNLIEVCNFAIRDRFGSNSTKVLQVETNRWYPQLALMSQKIVIPANIKADIHVPVLFCHHWFCSSHAVLTDYSNDPNPSLDPKDYHGDESSIRQWLWELSFTITETIRGNIEQQFGHLIQTEILRLTQLVTKNEYTLQLLHASTETMEECEDTDEQIRCEEENRQASITCTRLQLFKKSKLLVNDTYPGYQHLNFIRLRYSFFAFNNALYYAPPWSMIRPSFVADEHSLGYLNQVKISCMINNGIELRVKLQPMAVNQLRATDHIDELIYAVKQLSGTSQHNNRSLNFERFHTVGSAYRGILVPLTLYEGDTVDARWVPIDKEYAYLALHDEVLDREHEQLVMLLLETARINPVEAYTFYRAFSVFGLHENDIVHTLAQRMQLQEDPQQVALALQYSHNLYKKEALQCVPECMALHEPSLKASLSQLVAERDLENPISLREPLLALLLNNHSVTRVFQKHMDNDQNEMEEEEEDVVKKHPRATVPQVIVSNILRYTARFIDTPTSLLPVVQTGNINGITPKEVIFMSQEIAKQLVAPLRVQVKIIAPTLAVPLPAGRRWNEPDEDNRVGAFDKALAHVSCTLRKAVRNAGFKQDLLAIKEGSPLCARELATMQLLLGVLGETNNDPALATHIEKVVAKHKTPAAFAEQQKPPVYYDCMRILVSNLDALDTVPRCVWDALLMRFSSDAKTADNPIQMIKDLLREVCRDNGARRRAARVGMQSAADHELVKVLMPTPAVVIRPASAVNLNNKRTLAEVRGELQTTNLFTRRK